MLALLLLQALLLAASPALAADGAASYVERLPGGLVDWGTGLVQVRGASSGEGKAVEAGQAEALRQARQSLVEVLRSLTLTSGQPVGAALRRNPAAAAELTNLASGARIVERRLYSDGSVELVVALSIKGGFLQLILPPEVTSIVALQQVNGRCVRPGEPYTGLVVDARRLGLRPALCPRVLCEDGSVVFGPAQVRREAAVQSGVAAYATSPPTTASGKAGGRPLVVRGLRSAGPSGCDVVISRADANRIRSAPESVEFLQRCRVLIVVD